MQGVGQVVTVLAAAGAGGVAGWAVRVLLGRLRRGVVLRPGPTEAAAALITGVGTAVAWGESTVVLVLLAGFLLVALSGVDIVHHRLPDALTLPALPLAAVVVTATHLVEPVSGSLVVAAGAAVVLWGMFAGVARLSPAWMGGGDVKLIPTLGLLMGYLSVGAVLVGLLVAFGIGSLVSVTGMATGRLRLTSAIPLGPYLLLGCWSVLLFPAYVT